MLLNPPQNSYLPLDYDPKWVEGATFAPTMERRLHDFFAMQGSSLLLYMFSSIVYNN